MLELAGFQAMVFEDFYDVLVSLVQQVVQPDHEGKRLTPGLLLKAFQHLEGKYFMICSLFRRTKPKPYGCCISFVNHFLL